MLNSISLSPPNYLAAAVLLLMPAISVELLSGNTTLASYLNPIIFVTFNVLYGGAALLIRETVLRWGKGFASLLILAAGYGMINEGVASKGMLDPHFYAVIAFGLENFGRVFGINIPWAINISIVHAIYSITIPILLAESLFPGNVRWLGNTAYKTLLAIFAATVFFASAFFSTYHAPLPSMVVILALIALFMIAAWKLPEWSLPKWKIRPGSLKMFLVGLIGAYAFWLIPHLIRPFLMSPSIYIALLVGGFIALPAYICMKFPPLTPPHARLALIIGLLVPMVASALLAGLIVPITIVGALLGVGWIRNAKT